MDVDQLFIRTLDDLAQRAAATDEYEVLLSAGLLRKLLMDSKPLMDQANAAHRLKIRFPMNGESDLERVIHEDAPVFWSLQEAIDLDSPLAQMPGTRAPIDATRDQLLARRILRMQATWVTVRDLIDQLAHIEGAVHSGRPQNNREELLEAAERFFYVGRLPGGVAQVRSIGRVVVRGLTPLKEAIASARALGESA